MLSRSIHRSRVVLCLVLWFWSGQPRRPRCFHFYVVESLAHGSELAFVRQETESLFLPTQNEHAIFIHTPHAMKRHAVRYAIDVGEFKREVIVCGHVKTRPRDYAALAFSMIMRMGFAT